MQSQISEIARLLLKNDNFLIVTHEHPDGDALGSSFALLNILKENGKSADLLIPEELPETYLDFVPCGYRSYLDPYEHANFNWCLSLDNTDMERAAVGCRRKLGELKIPVINIDHHPDNRCFGQFNLIMPEAAATAEIVYHVIREAGWKISARTATLLLIGIIMDTGGFRFDNTSADVLEIAAELIRHKADHHGVIKNMFFSKHLPYVQFESELISHHLRLNQSGRFGWIYIPETVIERYGINMKNAEGLIEGLRSIGGMDIVALLQKREDGVKVSLRSKDARYPVGNIARTLNGGGHELAAGCMIKTESVEMAEKILLSHVERVLNEV